MKTKKQLSFVEVGEAPYYKTVEHVLHYSSLSLEMSGVNHVINFVNEELMGDDANNGGWHESDNKIFINLLVCEKGFKENTDLLKKYYNRD